MIKKYLIAYNLTAFCFWLFYLVSFTASQFQLTPTALLLLNIAQGMAVLEILHAILKWVKSPIGSTIAQVASRLLVLICINLFIGFQWPHTIFSWGVTIVSFAWSITELTRYSFYFLILLGKQPAVLVWMRYSFFIVLYPLGVTGEWFILFTPVLFAGLVLNHYNILLVPVLVSYLYYFPVLYKYMWKQRKAKLL